MVASRSAPIQGENFIIYNDREIKLVGTITSSDLSRDELRGFIKSGCKKRNVPELLPSETERQLYFTKKFQLWKNLTDFNYCHKLSVVAYKSYSTKRNYDLRIASLSLIVRPGRMHIVNDS